MRAVGSSPARWWRGAVTVVVVAAVLTPDVVAHALDGPATSTLSATRDELADANRELDEIEVELRRVDDELATVEVDLLAATTELSRVSAELDDAQAALTRSNAAERAATARLLRAQRDLETSLEDFDTRRRRLADRLVEAYKHGGATTEQLAVQGVLGASDWHGVAVTLETVGRLAAEEDTLVDEAVVGTRTRAALRAGAGDARQLTVTAARAAAEHRRQVERLAAGQERLVAEVAARRDRQRRLLRSLEADANVHAALVENLERRVAELEYAARTVLVPVDVDLEVDGPPPAWADRLPPAGRPYAAAIEATAARHGLDGRLLAALVWTESAFRADAVSHAGALGLAQLMPATARGLGVDPRDPLQNLDGGARYLREQLDRFERVDLALAAYNAGPGRVERTGGIPEIVETQLYVVRVLERLEQLRA